MLIKVIVHSVWHVWEYTRLRPPLLEKNVANLVLVSMWTSVKADYRKPAQAIWSYKIQKLFDISPTSNRRANISSPLTCIEMNLIYFDIFEAFTSNCKTYLNQDCVSLFRTASSNSIIIPLGDKPLRLIYQEPFLKPLQRCIIPGLLSGSLRHRISYVCLTNLTPPLANFSRSCPHYVY